MNRRAVLFDFDGTLADSAPDLAAALNRMRTQRGLQPLEVEATRSYVSMGARGMLRAHGGDVEALSNPDGIGACLRITLPPAPAQPLGPDEDAP